MNAMTEQLSKAKKKKKYLTFNNFNNKAENEH